MLTKTFKPIATSLQGDQHALVLNRGSFISSGFFFCYVIRLSPAPPHEPMFPSRILSKLRQKVSHDLGSRDAGLVPVQRAAGNMQHVARPGLDTVAVEAVADAA